METLFGTQGMQLRRGESKRTSMSIRRYGLIVIGYCPILTTHLTMTNYEFSSVVACPLYAEADVKINGFDILLGQLPEACHESHENVISDSTGRYFR
jgi:hypothetical protein